MIADGLYPEPRDYLESRVLEDHKLSKIICDPYRREFEAEQLDYLLDYSKLRFNTSTLQLQVDGFAAGAKQDDSFPVSAGGALRLLKKYSLWADINSFLSQGVEELWMDGSPDDIPDCVCRKDGRWYALQTIRKREHYRGEEYFVPVEVFCNPFHHSYAREVSMSEVKAVMAIRFTETFYIEPLDSIDWCVDFPEFKLLRNGFATDGSGVIYEGERCVDKLVRLFAYVPYGQDLMVDKVKNDTQSISKDEFIALVCKKADEKLAFEQKMREEREAREYEDMTRHLIEKGLIDIYGEPGGWCFNNEDWC